MVTGPAPALPAWAETLFAAPIAPAGHGVWHVVGDRSTATISEQFKADAGEYHARYAASDHFTLKFRQALDATGAQVADQPLILDLGSGSGVNSVAPCLEIFPGARAVATDLSGELLAILARHAEAVGISEQVVGVVMDAMGEDVMPGRFDLVTGVANLHHLVYPKLGLAAAARALKPGGTAIFMEPFDGYALVRLAYERILAEAALRGEPLEPDIDRTLRAMVTDLTVRAAAPPEGPGLEALDDKWLFSREQVTAMARDVGFTGVEFVAQNDKPHLYRKIAEVQLRLATGRDDLALPEWAVEIMDSFDRAILGPGKRLMMLEGAIVLTKGGAP